MRSTRLLVGTFAGLIALTIGSAYLTTRTYPNPYPPLAQSLTSPLTRLSDMSGIALGYRKLTADLAWVQTLIYYGTHEEGTPEEEQENGGGRYPLFLAYCQRVARLDPYFNYVYFYGGTVLGWN